MLKRRQAVPLRSKELLRGLVLVAAVGGLASSCGGGHGHRMGSAHATPTYSNDGGVALPAHPKHGGVLHALYQGDVDFIDPGMTYSNVGYFITAATQRAVVGYPPDSRVAVPDLASALPQVSPDGKTVMVKLRAGVRFSPPVGRAVSSKDVKYAIERGFFRTVNNGYAATYFGDLVGAQVGGSPGRRIR